MATCKLQMTIFVILHNELVLLFGSGTWGKSSDGWIMSSIKNAASRCNHPRFREFRFLCTQSIGVQQTFEPLKSQFNFAIADGNNQPLALLNIHLPVMMLADMARCFQRFRLNYSSFSTILAEQSGFTD